MKPSRKTVFVTSVILLLFIAMIAAVVLGAKNIPLSTIWDSIFHYTDTLDMQLVQNLRIPRMLSTLFVGGLLGICGCLMQGVTRNPLAEPSILGISQGATLAISILYMNMTWLTTFNIFLGSFIGALSSGLLIILFTSLRSVQISVTKLLLAGTALSTFFLSLSTVMGILSNNSQMIAFFIAGGFQNTSWFYVWLLIIFSIIGMMIAMYLAPHINVVALGDDVAVGLGSNPKKIRFIALLLVIPLSALCVVVGRNIAFVGLIIPQITKRIMGNDYRQNIPVAFVSGALLLVVADIIARLINSPFETPIGIFTSLIGVPFFIYLVRKEKRA